MGAYPNGGRYDLMKGLPEERRVADENIEFVPLPDTDPVYYEGPLQLHWKFKNHID